MLKGSFNRLLASIQTLKGVGPATAKHLRARQIETLEDALFFLPVRYQDRRRVVPLGRLVEGQEALVAGRIASLKAGAPRGRSPFRMTIDDGSGRLTATWFRFKKAAFDSYETGREITLFGRVEAYRGGKVMVHPEIIPEKDRSSHLNRFVPVYREIPGVSPKAFRRFVQTIIKAEMGRLSSPLPERIVNEAGLLDLSQAFSRVHFPESEEEASLDGPPRQTLTFTELFLFQAGLAASRKRQQEKTAPSIKAFDQTRRQVAAALPFSLTAAQERVLDELAIDLEEGRPMNRLLQGDVGSGKTVLAAVALLAAALSGHQAALMAPTEILAEQHYQNLVPLAEKAGVRLELLTGSLNQAQRRERLAELAAGQIQAVIGTHALIQEKVSFASLGLAIIDEQHRFGVLQRAALGDKGTNPHTLVMTATPIPRSLALTLYGDLDISILDEKPAGRQQVVTRLIPPARLKRAWQAIQSAVSQGLQAYVVLPAIEPGEGLVSAEERLPVLEEALPGLKIGLLHGRMSSEEQTRSMASFASGEVDVLVATTVIEVGLDVPKAAVMVIENAERFGLAQIHQLRGRVGRGGTQAACLLVSEAKGPAYERLRLLEETDDGFKIAEADLNFRGPGEFLGPRQTGLPDFRLANLLADTRLLAKARQAAFGLVERDPGLEAAEHRTLKDILDRRWFARLRLSRVG